MANLKDVIYLSNADYNTLISTGTVTIDGTTLTYDENNIYITPEEEATTSQAGLMSAADKTKLNSLVSGTYVRYDTASQGLSTTQKSNARTNIGAGTSNLTLGGNGSASTASHSDHTHTTTLATDTGTSSITLAHDGKYKLTAGGNSVIFTMPSDNNTTYTFATGASDGNIQVTPSGGSAQQVAVKGLQAAAYKYVATSISSSSDDSHLATAKAVYDAIEALPEPMVFKGSVGTGGTVTWANLPSAASTNVGWTYKVITDHTADTKAPTCKVGDTIISTGSEWAVIPSGDEPSGTVTSVGVSVPTGLSVSGTPVTSSGTIAITYASGYSIPTTTKQSEWDGKQDALATQTAYTSKGSATKVPQITTNTLGQVTNITEVTITDNNDNQTVKGNGTAFGANAAVDIVGSGIVTVTGDASNNKITISASHQGIKSLDTTATTAQSTSSSEAIAGSGTVKLHKVAKTGTYSDLIGKPDAVSLTTTAGSEKITVGSSSLNVVTRDTTQTISGDKTFSGSVYASNLTTASTNDDYSILLKQPSDNKVVTSSHTSVNPYNGSLKVSATSSQATLGNGGVITESTTSSITRRVSYLNGGITIKPNTAQETAYTLNFPIDHGGTIATTSDITAANTTITSLVAGATTTTNTVTLNYSEGGTASSKVATLNGYSETEAGLVTVGAQTAVGAKTFQSLASSQTPSTDVYIGGSVAVRNLTWSGTTKTVSTLLSYGSNNLSWANTSTGKIRMVDFAGLTEAPTNDTQVYRVPNKTDGVVYDLATTSDIHNATLTIQKNGTTVNTFTANSSTDVTANITVPTTLDDISDGSTRKLANYLPLTGGTLTGANDPVLTIKRGTSSGGAFIRYYNNNQDTNYWRVGMFSDGTYKWQYNNADKVALSTGGTLILNNNAALSAKDTNDTVYQLIRLTSGNNVAINGGRAGDTLFYTHIRPSADDASLVDVGTSDYQWRNMYSTKYTVNNKITMQYNSAEDCLDFVFA